jgi:hypothetical protein
MLDVTNKPIVLRVIMLSVIMLSVIMLRVFMLSVIMLRVMAPENSTEQSFLMTQELNHSHITVSLLMHCYSVVTVISQCCLPCSNCAASFYRL